ncbi:MAG: hypothetical protein ACYS8I_06730 [Planctomycetota bacterium]|jgi:hypothetical protein
MAIDPDVQVLLDQLELLVVGLEGRVAFLEANSSGGGSWEPVEYTITLEDGSQRVFKRG